MAAPVPSGPRIRVAALIVDDGKVVLVRHRAGDSVYYLLPGGGVEHRETIEEALLREVREETGLVVSLGPLLFVNDTIDPVGPRHIVNLTFAATRTGGSYTQVPIDRRVEAVELLDVASLATIDFRPPLATAIAALMQVEPPDWRARYLGSIFSEAP